MEENRGNGRVAGQTQSDIVCSLPLELLFEVVEYLDVADIVRSQRVSKRWRTMFLGDVITRSVLPRTLAALGLDAENIATSEAITYFRWLHGLKSARPVKKAFLPRSQLGGKIEQIVYHSRRLCYIIAEGDGNQVVMLDLDTGRRSLWVNDARSYLREIVLSDRYLVMISWARPNWVLLVWDIHTSQRLAERRFLWVPSRVTVEKDKAIIIPSPESRSYPIYIWDLCTDRFQKIGSFSNLELSFVDVEEDVLMTFEIDWDKHLPEVRQTKWSLTRGEQLDWKRYHLSMGSRHVDRTTLKQSHNDWYRPSGYKTVTALYTFANDPYSAIRLTYDHAVDRLDLRWISCTKPINDFAVPGRCDSLAPHIIYRYAVQHRGIVVYDAISGVATVHPYHLHAGEVVTRRLFGAHLPVPGRQAPMTEFMPFYTHWSFGDREVFGVATRDGIQLWFFNPNFVPDFPGAEPFLAMEESG